MLAPRRSPSPRWSARERCDAQSPQSGGSGRRITIFLRGGDYVRTNALELIAADSGTADSPLVWRAYKNENVRLLGGRTLTGFAPVADATVLARLDEPARGHVLQLDLRALGITDFGEMKSRGFSRAAVPAHCELFFNHRPMTLARWPNAGEFAKIAGYPAASDHVDEHGGNVGQLPGGFHYAGDRPQRWRDVSDLWVHGYWSYDWANSYEQVASLDVAQRLVKTAAPHGLYGFRKNQRFYFLNRARRTRSAGRVVSRSQVRHALLLAAGQRGTGNHPLPARPTAAQAQGRFTCHLPRPDSRSHPRQRRRDSWWREQSHRGLPHPQCRQHRRGDRRRHRSRRDGLRRVGHRRWRSVIDGWRPPDAHAGRAFRRELPLPAPRALVQVLRAGGGHDRRRSARFAQSHPRSPALRDSLLGQRSSDGVQRDSSHRAGDRRRRGDLHRPRLHFSRQPRSATISFITPAAWAWGPWAFTWTTA